MSNDKPKDSAKRWETAEERNALLDAVMEKHGFKPAPPDHWIYREGATIIFPSARPKTKRKDDTK